MVIFQSNVKAILNIVNNFLGSFYCECTPFVDFFYNCNIVIGLLRNENEFQLIINLFIIAQKFRDAMIY
jgi:hypothetical protein